MSESDAASSAAQANEAARAQLVNRLQRLWQSDPGSYWKEFRASGLEPKEVWADAFDYTESESSRRVVAKPPSRK